MKRKILCSIIVLSCLFCLSVPCLAYIQSSTFNPRDAYVNCVPYSVRFLRDNQILYLYGDDNVLSKDFYYNDDSNLDYRVNHYTDVFNTPFAYTDYTTDEVVSIAQYRYMSSNKAYLVSANGVPGYYSKLVNLMTCPDLFVYTDDTADIYLNVRFITPGGVTRVIDKVYTIYPDEQGRAYFGTWNNIYYELLDMGISHYLEQPIYLSVFQVNTSGFYYGCGTYRFLANMDSYTFPTLELGGFNNLSDRITIHDALQSVGIVFRGIHNFMSIEILPFMTFYRLLGIALCIPITIKVIRSV